MKRCILVLALLLGAYCLKSQTLYVSGNGSVTAQNVPVSIGGNAAVATGATPLVGATVSISSNFVSGQDILGINGVTSGSDGSISYSYNSTTGVLTLSGATTAENYQTTFRKVTGTSIRWYSDASGGTAVPSATALVNGTTYYATRLAVTVTIN